jgi:hypothetical protein
MRVHPAKESHMKRHLYALAAVASLLAGSAFAQGAECEAGSAWGAKPGCNGAQTQPSQIYGNSGWTPEQAYGGNGNLYPYVIGQALGSVVLPDGRVVPRYQQQYQQYPRTRRDRDGDGVPNWNDRYPDDPRYQ